MRRRAWSAFATAVLALLCQSCGGHSPATTLVAHGCPAEAVALMGRPSGPELLQCSGWNDPALAAGTRPATVLQGDPDPRQGESCQRVYFYRVVFSDDGGGPRATFAFAGGVTRGSFPISTALLNEVGDRATYVADLQAGSYEEPDERSGRRLSCTLAPTYHFDCPVERRIDVLCYMWLEHGVPRAFDQPERG